ncbi:MAG TPA: hypothetical protein DGG94_23160 [Micromonosporaceae bacterium]|nr:hypothetical protein [Micromonosporaceae bacterium]HCU52651.1 hypothetical protein [Micromonosporaceae bacterium]
MRGDLVTLFLCGDVMTGRGVDQILAHPSAPQLWERFVSDARFYVELAEAVNGPIPRPAGFSWPWGDALATLEDFAPDVRIINLETSITTSADAAIGKGVHYRMHPKNIFCLLVARPDVCTLANNHVLDFGQRGHAETLQVLATAGIPVAGAGPASPEAQRPAAVTLNDGSRVLVFSMATESSGVPRSWAATPDRPGVDLLPDLSPATLTGIADRVRAVKGAHDLVVASLHWGSNWGYDVPAEHVRFAHQLIDSGVDVVHGHSSHHPRPIEIYRGKLILYGCGDFIDDYEGIAGHAEYRDDLRLLYFASVRPGSGLLDRLSMVALQARQMRLHHASAADKHWLRTLLNAISADLPAPIRLTPHGTLDLSPRRLV